MSMKRFFTMMAATVLMSASLTLEAAAQGDSAIDAARASGLVGEQADGYLGFVPGASIPADLRGRVEQNNIRRRALYTQRATERNATVNEMAAAVACEVFQNRIQVGERYRDQGGQWRQRTASQPVVVPSFCN
jgi:hypothetical protein